jgi:hypothetical protein
MGAAIRTDRPRDVSTYAGTILGLGSVALLATLVPAIRAVTIAPVIVSAAGVIAHGRRLRL